MLEPEEKSQIKNEIEQRIKAAQKTIRSLKEQTKPIPPNNAIGRITRMDAIQQKSMNEANLNAAEESLLKLKESLSKLEDTQFGVCVRCQKPIPVARILAIPESSHCVGCAGRLF